MLSHPPGQRSARSGSPSDSKEIEKKISRPRCSAAFDTANCFRDSPRARHSDAIRRPYLKTADAVIWRPKSIANNEKPALDGGSSSKSGTSRKSGAGEGARTLDPDLGKVVLYH
jgi:hypothetical protein